ncbi:MAG TPA: hypothetical protein P5262_04065 [Candidatus Moranbacteria bacterium]|nr:hypothetical protein [Candidatus Moranbacteria bacterium]
MCILTADVSSVMGLFGNNHRVEEVNLRILRKLSNNALDFDFFDDKDKWTSNSLQKEEMEFLFGLFNPCPRNTPLPPHLIARPNSRERR